METLLKYVHLEMVNHVQGVKNNRLDCGSCCDGYRHLEYLSV